MEEDNKSRVVGLEDGKLWLPDHVIQDACNPQGDSLGHPTPVRGIGPWHPNGVLRHTDPTSNWKLHRKRQRSFTGHHPSGGSGMQAIFINSGQRSCGTGFFLPRRPSNNFQPIKKPACSSVLLPSRVVQALNLNVHALGSHIMPLRDNLQDQHQKLINDECEDNKAEYLLPQWPRKCSPEMLLPKEWSY